VAAPVLQFAGCVGGTDTVNPEAATPGRTGDSSVETADRFPHFDMAVLQHGTRAALIQVKKRLQTIRQRTASGRR
jgi:hypothetical protein